MMASSARGGVLRGEMSVRPPDREDVVGADPDSVGVIQLHYPVIEDGKRRRVVHDAGPAAVGRGHVVVRETEGVPHFMRGKLRDPGEGEIQG